MAGHHHVIGFGSHFTGVLPHRHVVLMGDPAAKTHRVGDVGARELPGRAILQPGVRVFDLVAVVNFLGEHAVLVANAIPDRRQPQRGHGVQKTRSQPTQAPIAQGRITLQLGHVFKLAGVLGQACGGTLGQVQGGQRIGKAAPHQKLHRQVHHTAGLVAALLCLRGDPAP